LKEKKEKRTCCFLCQVQSSHSLFKNSFGLSGKKGMGGEKVAKRGRGRKNPTSPCVILLTTPLFTAKREELGRREKGRKKVPSNP